MLQPPPLGNGLGGGVGKVRKEKKKGGKRYKLKKEKKIGFLLRCNQRI